MNEAKKMMHLGIHPGDISGYVLLPGSPERALRLSKLLDNAQEVACFREYRTFTGFLDGHRVSITSTGMGGPSMAIALEELHECGAHTVIRVGTCAAVSPLVHTGDVILPNGAVRMENVADHYSPKEYPAVPDMDVLEALETAAAMQKRTYHIGIDITKAVSSSQYVFNRPWGEAIRQRWQAYVAAGALSAEMGCAPMFIAASAMGMRSGAVLAVTCEHDEHPVYQSQVPVSCESITCETAVEGLRQLLHMDHAKD